MRDGTKDGIEGEEIPFGNYRMGGDKRVSGDGVIWMTQNIRGIEDKKGEKD